MTKKSFVAQNRLASDLLNLIHSIGSWPLNTQARGGFIYFITFTDYHVQYGYIHLIKYESKAFEKFNEFRLEAYVLETTTTLLNVALSKIVAKTLYGLWHGKPTFYKYLRFSEGRLEYLICLRDIAYWTSSSLGLNGFINESLEPMGIGEVTTFKARLVAKGYTQRPDMNFEETNSRIAIAKSIQILLAISAYYDYEICRIDVKNNIS
ncbi:UNVERIFIED_CONTAM: hypothetical protein Scaly_0686400 [Sesamum calycinum]|uniref:Reverse transcriptase Ty1/copia-type domain-containing protein n=1 Tax=Sesamum calycinum TaxID=2727403 RepID=A0AAW2R6P4_9LAMI